MSGLRLNQIRYAAPVLALLFGLPGTVIGQAKNPVLSNLFPPGGLAGSTVEVVPQGSDLDGLTSIVCSCPGIVFRPAADNRFAAVVSADAPTGCYDIRVVGANGVSSPRTFVIGTRPEQIESSADNDSSPQVVALNSVVNGRVEKNGDVDTFRFDVRAGNHLIIECRAERIDSRLRGVLELFDPSGRRVATSRGYFGIDPLIDFRAPTDGAYTLKIYDRTYTGSNDHFYRLSIDAGPRVLFAFPSTVAAGSKSRVTLYGWNLTKPQPGLLASNDGNVAKGEFGGAGSNVTVAATQSSPALSPEGPFDRIEVEVTAPKLGEHRSVPLLLRSAQASLDTFAHHYPGSDEPVPFCITDVPVVLDHTANHTPQAAQPVQVPAEINGQLKAGDERDWFAFDARRGEVLWFEALGQRLGSPVDLEVHVFDADGKTELAAFQDELQNLGGHRFPTNHLDAAGRWVAPAGSRYLVVVRNVIGGLDEDPRRCYRLSVRREEPTFDVIVLPGENETPASLNIARGGRSLAEVIAVRRRGMNGAMHLTAENLPAGIDCPDIWLGPGISRAPLIVSARLDAQPIVGALQLSATADGVDGATTSNVRGGVMMGSDSPNGAGRITSEIALAVAGESPIRLTAASEHEKYPQGSIVNIAVDVERPAGSKPEPVKLTGLILPEFVDNQIAAIPTDATRGYICFRLPKDIAPGHYTFAVRGDTTLTPLPANGATTAPAPTSHVLYSNAVTFEVYSAPYLVSVDLNAPKKLKRGEIMQLNYVAHRQNGFIGKIHTDLYAPGGVVGIRGRGVTFTGQVETGVIQIIASDDAPLGPIKFLQLEGLGTVEDNPIYRANCFVDLEVTK